MLALSATQVEFMDKN